MQFGVLVNATVALAGLQARQNKNCPAQPTCPRWNHCVSQTTNGAIFRFNCNTDYNGTVITTAQVSFFFLSLDKENPVNFPQERSKYSRAKTQHIGQHLRRLCRCMRQASRLHSLQQERQLLLPAWQGDRRVANRVSYHPETRSSNTTTFL